MARERQLTRGMDFEAVAAVDLSSYYFVGGFFFPAGEGKSYFRAAREREK